MSAQVSGFSTMIKTYENGSLYNMTNAEKFIQSLTRVSSLVKNSYALQWAYSIANVATTAGIPIS